jgi:transposase
VEVGQGQKHPINKNRRKNEEEKQQPFVSSRETNFNNYLRKYIMPLPRLKLINPKPKQINASGWKKLITSLDGLEGHWQFGEIIDLDGWSTIQYKETSHHVFILAELTTKVSCPCGANMDKVSKHGFTRAMKLLDRSIRNKFTEIHFRVRRFKCRSCKATLQQEVPGRHEDHNLTARLVKYVEDESLYIFKSFFDITLETGVHPCIIRNIFTNHGRELERNRVIITPRYFAMDEVYLSTRKSVRCVLTAPEEKKVLELLKDNSLKTIETWLRQLPDSHLVEAVSMDMCPLYLSIIKDVLPGAVVVVDRYHVQNLLNTALKEVLAVIGAGLTVTQHRKSMRRQKLILKNRHTLADYPTRDGMNILPPEKEEVREWFETFPLLAKAYRLKEDFSDILQLNDRQVAEERTDRWLEQVDEFVETFENHYKKECKRLKKYPFQNVTSSFRTWRPYILNYIDFKFRFNLKVTNGFAEFANKQIKKAYAIGNGYRYDVLRTKLVHGGLMKKKMPLNPLDDIPSAKPRKRVKRQSPNKTRRNPNSNVQQLKKDREGNDRMIGLLPKPQDNEDWGERFIVPEPVDNSSPLSINFGISDEEDEKPNLLIYNRGQKEFSQKKKKKGKSDQNNPPPLFQFFDELDADTGKEG